MEQMKASDGKKAGLRASGMPAFAELWAVGTIPAPIRCFMQLHTAANGLIFRSI
jgi:hypothetical protein